MASQTALALQTSLSNCEDRDANFSHTANLDEFLESLRPLSQRRRLGPHSVFAKEGEKADAIFRILTGCVRLCRHLPDGRRPVADFLFAGDLFGLGTMGTYAVSAETVTAVSLISYPSEAFAGIAQSHDGLRDALLAHLSRALVQTQSQLFLLNGQNARARVAAFLLRLRGLGLGAASNRIDLPMGRQDIADHLGLSVETVCRAFTALRRDGLIEIKNPQLILIADVEALQGVAEVSPLPTAFPARVLPLNP